jgi:hypothetical protein
LDATVAAGAGEDVVDGGSHDFASREVTNGWRFVRNRGPAIEHAAGRPNGDEWAHSLHRGADSESVNVPPMLTDTLIGISRVRPMQSCPRHKASLHALMCHL